jgi:choline-glycine betaine transporter
MAASEEGLAHPYVDIAHRAALLYSFATLLLAALVELSGFATAVNLIAAFVPIFFFVTAIAGYMIHGARRDTDNQFRDPVAGTTAFMWALMIGEIGGVLVLIAGFADGQL